MILKSIQELNQELAIIEAGRHPYRLQLILHIKNCIAELQYGEYACQPAEYDYSILITRLRYKSAKELEKLKNDFLELNLFVPLELSFVLDEKNREEAGKLLTKLLEDQEEEKKMTPRDPNRGKL
jgi:hypothetical protein